MRKDLVWLAAGLSLICCSSSSAQYYLFRKYYEPAILAEWGIGGGMMHAFTDLGGNSGIGKPLWKDMNFSFSKPCASVYILAQYKRKISLRLQVNAGSVGAADSILKDKGESFGRYDRNLHFRSRILEGQLGVEIYPAGFRDYEYRDPPAANGYVYMGVGYYHFNPRACLDNNWYDLQPLHTEGQGFAEYPDRSHYRLWQTNLAAGMGVRWQINEKMVGRLELVHRFMFTDYLDDVSSSYIEPALFYKYLPSDEAAYAHRLSDRRKERNPAALTHAGDQRGNPHNKDAWLCLQLKIGYMPGSQRK